MNCNEAIQLVLAAQAGQVETQIDLALTYIRNHPGCQARLDQFTRAILSDLEYELSCTEARQEFLAYYTREQEDGKVAETFPDLHNHLQRCPYCQFDYHTMRGNVQAYEQNLIPQIQPSPTFALAFLPPLPLWKIHDRIRTFTEEIAIFLSQAVASFGPFSARLEPALATAVPLRNKGQTAGYAALLLPDADANIRFQIEVATIDQTQARVTLHIFEAATNRTVRGARVTLRTMQRELLTSLLTESDGQATFPGLGEGKYLFQIRYQESTWELPIVMMQRPQSQSQSQS